MFRKSFLLAAVSAVFTAMLTGCAAVPLGIAAGIESSKSSADLEPFVEITEVRINKGVTLPTLQSAKVFSAVVKYDMKIVKDDPSPTEKEILGVIEAETLRLLQVTRNEVQVSSLEIIPISICYVEGGISAPSFYEIVNKKANREWYNSRWWGMKKMINFRLVLQRDNTVLLEASGLWGGKKEADEIAGARQLAREVASEVLKKLSASTAPPREGIAEAETNRK